MWVVEEVAEPSAPQRFPSTRSPVPQSRMNFVPSGAASSRQGVLPPYRHVAGSTVGVEPRTPQKLNLAIGLLICPCAVPGCPSNGQSYPCPSEPCVSFCDSGSHG